MFSSAFKSMCGVMYYVNIINIGFNNAEKFSVRDWKECGKVRLGL